MRTRLALTAFILLAASLAVWISCSDDGGSAETHWFDCKPVLAKLAECGITVSFDGFSAADPDDAYQSCEFAHGNMWLRMYKCYKEHEDCAELAECLPDHGFIGPDDDTGDTDDTAAADDAADDSADDTGADDTADDSADDSADDTV